jgi:hypothetical protein
LGGSFWAVSALCCRCRFTFAHLILQMRRRTFAQDQNDFCADQDNELSSLTFHAQIGHYRGCAVAPIEEQLNGVTTPKGYRRSVIRHVCCRRHANPLLTAAARRDVRRALVRSFRGVLTRKDRVVRGGLNLCRCSRTGCSESGSLRF